MPAQLTTTSVPENPPAEIGPDSSPESKRVLEPNERISEVLFGLTMVLTFTGSLSIADAGRDDVRTMLIGALGCNLAWGIIDAVFYLMGCLAEKGSRLATLRAVRNARNAQEARKAIADALPPALVEVFEPMDFDNIRQRLSKLPDSPYPRLTSTDWKGALSVFLLVFLSTFPVTVPFMFLHNVMFAMRVSNGIAILMLFFAGVAYGRCIGRTPWGLGIFMVVFGSILVAMTIALGG